MFVAFFESAKYVGHLYPIALMRIYLGYYFLNMAIGRLSSEFLNQPRLAHIITENLPHRDLPVWYANVLQHVVVRHWQIFAYFITYCEFIIGISLLIGFLVRPTALLGIFLMLNYVYIGGGGGATVSGSADLQQVFLALFIILFWVGAGRCFGFDFYFYKRQRGLWW